MEIKTLKDWINAMSKYNPSGHVNLRTANNMTKLFNDELVHAVVFDNAGGMKFDIWDFKSKEEVEGFLALDTFRDDLIFGHVIDGVQTLSEYQKEFLHWDIDQKMNPRPIDNMDNLNSWKGID